MIDDNKESVIVTEKCEDDEKLDFILEVLFLEMMEETNREILEKLMSDGIA